MTCLHHYASHPTLAVLYCERCGDSKPLQVERQESASPRTTPRKPRAASARQDELPFGMPVAINREGGSMFDTPAPPTIEDLASLERSFFGADPVTQAAVLEAMAQRRGGKPPPQGDPPNTYRPGESETIGRNAGIDAPNR